MEDIYIGTPNAKQDEFLRCKKKYVAFGGARGGGKSWAVRCKAKLLAQRYPGIRMLLVRRTMPEIEANHVETLRLELAGTAVYRAEERRFVFGNGSVLQFGYCACDRDADRYQGAEYDVIFFDEATQLKEQWMRKLAACVRGVNGFPKRIYYTCNPGGPGHRYIKRLFIDRRYEPGENGGEYAFIPARVTDNGALLARQPEYIRQLEALPPKLRAAWLEGRWDVLAGQVFQEFTDDPAHYADRRWTHVIRPFDIPREWNVYRSYDFGYAKPFSCGWWAVDFDGCVYRILELYGCTGTPDEGVLWTPERQFAEIRRMEDEHPYLRGRTIRGVADPAIWDASRGESIYETALKHRLFFEKGDNRRIPGWMQLHYRMSFDGEGYPMLYVFESMAPGWGGAFISVAIIVAVLGSWLSFTILPSETTSLMAKHELLPPVFNRLNKKGSPQISLIVVGACTQAFMITLLFTEDAYNFAFSMCTVAIVITWAFAAAYQVKFSAQHHEWGQCAIGIVAVAFQVVGVLFNGWSFLLLTCVGYIPGFFFYWRARKEAGAKALTMGEKVGMGAISALGVLSLVLLAMGVISF